ncbi:hypothetical protein IG631_12393 [Alternaria alternata]|nr:hypothetical protein IG631_12393 [Alternaria alternata]
MRRGACKAPEFLFILTRMSCGLISLRSPKLSSPRALVMHSFVFILTLLSVVSATNPTPNRCKSFPGDKSWPSQSDWNSLNKTVGGRLVATVPLGAPCHGSTFDNATCESLKSQWQYEKIQ